MERFKVFLVALFALSIFAACGDDAGTDTQPQASAECTTDSKCDEKCDSDQEGDCRNGTCICIEKVTQSVGCTDDAFCTEKCNEGEDATCNADGSCTCVKTKSSCETADDCKDECNEGDKVSCTNSKCVCSETIVEAGPSCIEDDDCESKCPPATTHFSCFSDACVCVTETQLASCNTDAQCDASCMEGVASCTEEHICQCLVENPSCITQADCTDKCPTDTTVKCLGNACACEIEVPKPAPSCIFNADCDGQCPPEATSSTCNDQVCVCGTPMPSCTADAQCADKCDPDETPNCDNQVCKCSKEVTVPACTINADCDSICGAGVTAECLGDACKCTETVELGCIDETDCTLCPTDTDPACDAASGICHCNQPAPPPVNQIIMLSDFNSDRTVVAGLQGLPAATYYVFGTSAASPLDTLTVLNQPNGEGSPAVGTPAISQVYVSCAAPDGTSNGTTLSSSLNAAGTVTFTNMNCYDETGNGLKVVVTYNVNTTQIAGETLSGQEFRLVVDGVAHSLVGNKVVRKTILSYTDAPAGSNLLTNGAHALKGVNVAAHNAGSGSVARHVYGVQAFDKNAGGELQLFEFSYTRGANLIPNVSIRDLSGHDLTGSATPLVGSVVVVSFTEEQIVAPGTTALFSLEAMVAGAESGDKVVTWLIADNSPVTGKTAYGAPNTARLISLNLANGLFATANEFAFGPGQNLNVIVSDLSADAHVFALTEGGSSPDWFNGDSVVGLDKLTANTLVAQ